MCQSKLSELEAARVATVWLPPLVEGQIQGMLQLTLEALQLFESLPNGPGLQVTLHHDTEGLHTSELKLRDVGVCRPV